MLDLDASGDSKPAQTLGQHTPRGHTISRSTDCPPSTAKHDAPSEARNKASLLDSPRKLEKSASVISHFTPDSVAARKQAQRERPSVADLRKSFERTVCQNEKSELKACANPSPFAASSPSRHHPLDAVDDSTGVDDSFRWTHHGSPDKSKVDTSLRRKEEKRRFIQSEHVTCSGAELASIARSSNVLSRGNSTRSEISSRFKSRTLDAPFPTVPQPDPAHSLRSFGHQGHAKEMGYGLGSLGDGAPSLSSFEPTRRSKDFGTQTNLSYHNIPVAEPVQNGGCTHPNYKVPELRRLFDRSSPGSFMTFARQRCAFPDHGRDSPDQHQDIPSRHSASDDSSSMSQKPTPPTLTTEITINNFECTFLDGQEQFHCSKNGTSAQNCIPSPTPPPVDHESPLKDRIKHFEHLHRRSQSHATAPHDTGCVSMKTENSIPVVQKVVENRHPVRNIWRRISQSLTQSLDGSHEHYRSSYRESTTSVEYSRSPPYRSVFPLLPARKSFPFIPRFASDDTDNHAFGLDGVNESTPRPPDADIFRNMGDGATNSKPIPDQSTPNPQRQSIDSGVSHHTSVLTPSGLFRRAASQDREKLKEQKKKEKQREREERKKRIAQRRQNKLGESHRAASGSSKPGKNANTSHWEPQTASGFMVRKTDFSSGDLIAPKPRRPGQVKNIVNYYKEKSTSLLRIASGGHFGNSKEDFHSDGGAGTDEDQKATKEKGKGKATYKD